MTPDLTYTQDGMFTRFYPETEDGMSVWNEMARKTDGTAAVLNFEAPRVLAEIRAAGYRVTKAKPVTDSIDDMMAELEEAF